MGQIISCIVMGTSWCVCSAMGSLLTACCGNDKASTIPPGANSGRKRSVLLMIIAMIISFIYQYWVATAVVESTMMTNNNSTSSSSSSFFGNANPDLTDMAAQVAKQQSTNFIKDNWIDGCTKYEDSPNFYERCVGNSGVYRAASSATLFFVLAAITVVCKPSFNREVWPAKYLLFFILCIVTIFIPNEPLFLDVYMNIARIGGVFFIILQQIIFLDMAYNWNDSWVEKSNQAETDEGPGAGKKWLIAILISCGILFLGSLTVIGLMFHFFGGGDGDCTINNVFISVTLILCILVTIAQLTGEEGSLLSSAITCAYATYLCFSSLSRSPDPQCNPKLGEEDLTGIILGIGITMISLGWTGWSYTANKTMQEEDESVRDVATPPVAAPAKDEERKVTGVVTGTTSYGSNDDVEGGASSSAAPEADQSASNKGFSNSWKLNIVLALISCWFAMVVTSWGSIDTGGDRANPEVGKTSMWILIASQWLFMALYLWTLVAPRLFPDRDFS